MGLVRRMMITAAVGIAGGLALMTPVSSAAATERTDLINIDGETFKSHSIDGNGNAVTDQAYDIYSYEYSNYGYIYRTVVTPGSAASVVAEFEIDQPDLVKRTSTSTLLHQSNALFLEALTLHSPTGIGTITLNTAACDGNQDSTETPVESCGRTIDACKAKIRLDTVSTAGHDEPAFTFADSVVKCNDNGLTIIVDDSNASPALKAPFRARLQELLGTKADGTGLKMKARSRNTDF